jgi:hypothetical protein
MVARVTVAAASASIRVFINTIKKSKNGTGRICCQGHNVIVIITANSASSLDILMCKAAAHSYSRREVQQNAFIVSLETASEHTTRAFERMRSISDALV